MATVQTAVVRIVALAAWLHTATSLAGQETTPAELAAAMRGTAQASLLQDLQQRLDAQESEIKRLRTNSVETTYDKGLLFRTIDPDAMPFRLKVNGRM